MNAVPPPDTADPRTVWHRVREHKIIQWALAYLAAALALTHAEELIARAFEWPEFISRALIVVLALGLPLAITLAWYHGHRASRHVSGAEATIIAILLMIGSGLLLLLVHPHQPSQTQSEVELSSTDSASSAVPLAPGRAGLARGLIDPMRFQIPLPEKTLVGTGAFALSPDGRQLAFAASGPDGVPRLWVRPLDSLVPRPLPGTESRNLVALFFWSPDSRFIAFDAVGKLKKVSVSGGPAETICDSECAAGNAGRSLHRLRHERAFRITPVPVSALRGTDDDPRHAGATAAHPRSAGLAMLHLKAKTRPLEPAPLSMLAGRSIVPAALHASGARLRPSQTHRSRIAASLQLSAPQLAVSFSYTAPTLAALQTPIAPRTH